MVHCVAYDLNTPGKNYTPLIDAIKTYSVWWHHLDSTWFIVTNDAATTVRDRLKQYIDKNDELLVFEVGTNWAGVGFEPRAYDWFRSNWN